MLTVTAVSAVFFFYLGEQITGSLILGVSLTFSSTVLAIKVLGDNGELSSLHGRDAMSILILQDIVAIALLGFEQGRQPSYWSLALLLLPFLRPLANLLISRSQFELLLLLGVSFALLGGKLAETVSVTPDIGALLTCIMFTSHSKSEELAHKLWGIKNCY